MSDIAEIPSEVTAAVERSVQRILDRLKEELHQASRKFQTFFPVKSS